jgi:hypothetical protein
MAIKWFDHVGGQSFYSFSVPEGPELVRAPKAPSFYMGGVSAYDHAKKVKMPHRV